LSGDQEVLEMKALALTLPLLALAVPIAATAQDRRMSDMMMGGRGMDMDGGHMMVPMMFAILDADEDGKVSLEELQALQRRIFNAMDTNADGFITRDEVGETK
jgi:hypothetical protein